MSPPDILFLHGFATSGSVWRDVVAALPGRRCLTPDLRGFGSAEPAPTGWELDDWVDEAASFMAPLVRFVLVGHSMGGKLATLLAARRPAGLEHLILVAPSPPVPEPIPDRAKMLAARGDRAAAEDTARTISHRASRDPDVLDALVSDSLRTDRAAWIWWVQRGSRADVTDQAARIAVPTLLLAGADDTTIPAAFLTEHALPRLPGARMATLPGSRHMVPLDAPDALAAHIAELDKP